MIRSDSVLVNTFLTGVSAQQPPAAAADQPAPPALFVCYSCDTEDVALHWPAVEDARADPAAALPDWIGPRALAALGWSVAEVRSLPCPPAEHKGLDGQPCWNTTELLAVLEEGGDHAD